MVPLCSYLKSGDVQTVCPVLYSHSSTFALFKHKKPLWYLPSRKLLLSNAVKQVWIVLVKYPVNLLD